ncbi:MAG: radical SAM protein [Candidatus Omnitrophica bacterium]|nr:radical SAM protein [Candidatus Omnitrophota bacterium]
MKVALVLCPAWSREMPHLAIALLSASLKKNGHQVYNFDLNNDFYHGCSEKYKTKWRKEEDSFWTDPAFVSEFLSEHRDLIDRTVLKILSTDSQLIGFSVYFPNEIVSLVLARRIKEIDKRRVIVFGGFQCLRELKAESFIKDSNVDIVVVGEGDETILELAQKLEKNGRVDYCRGALLKKEGSFIDCGDRAPVMELDSLAFADFGDFTPASYEIPSVLPFLSSRGCFQRCVYCTVNSFWKKYRSMTADRIFREMKYQLNKSNGINSFFLYDPLLNGNVKELSRLCDLIIDDTTKGLMTSFTWCGEGIIRKEMSPELLMKMKQAGCTFLSYGIESGSQRVLDKMRKNLSISDAETVIRSTHDAGIFISLNFMFGFPTETEDDFQQTMDFIKRNRKYIDKVLPSESFCYIDRGTYLYEHAEEFGVLPKPNSSFWESADGKNNYPERLRRFEAFCELVYSLGIEIGVSRDKVKIFRDGSLKNYDAYKKMEQKTK